MQVVEDEFHKSVLMDRPEGADIIWYGTLPDGSECRILMNEDNQVDDPSDPRVEMKVGDMWILAMAAVRQLAIMRAAIRHWHKCGALGAQI